MFPTGWCILLLSDPCIYRFVYREQVFQANPRLAWNVLLTSTFLQTLVFILTFALKAKHLKHARRISIFGYHQEYWSVIIMHLLSYISIRYNSLKNIKENIYIYKNIGFVIYMREILTKVLEISWDKDERRTRSSQKCMKNAKRKSKG